MRPKVAKQSKLGPFLPKHAFEFLMFGFSGEVVKATNALERSNAWPNTASKFELLIEPGTQLEVRYGEHARGFSDESESFVPSIRQISAGSEFLSTPTAAELVDGVGDAQTVLVHALGHETFHMTEVERQAECKVPYRSVKSGFAKSVWPEMSQEWIDVCVDCAAHYRGHVRETPQKKKSYIKCFSAEALAAHDAVSEGCADLMGLMVVNAALGSLRGLDLLLPSARVNRGTAPSEYQSGEFLTLFIGKSLALDRGEIIKASWEYARDKLLMAPDCPSHLKSRLRSIRFDFQRPLPSWLVEVEPSQPEQQPHRKAKRSCL